MEELKKHLESAYNHLAKLQVSGDAVDLVALVRMELREAYAEANKPPEQAGEEQTDGQTD